MLRLEIYEDFLSALLPDVFRVASRRMIAQPAVSKTRRWTSDNK